ncbi:unnamed protein product [Clonostachys rosea]|uniref:Fungal N-terminal domain-containing protein n=1 Tax=Bionectria ochroleuca TaxID=29856 RepID=A0ABY6U5A0_BIOOC|nr:unnamed protein product [Clonostachys rosea]
MSGFGELANAIQIITGAVNTIRLVYQAYEAIRDVDQQIDHLISVCSLVEGNLSETLTLLCQQQASPNRDERRLKYYKCIAQVVKTVEKDLDEVKSRIPSPDRVPRPRILARVFRSRAYKATDLALNMNEKPLQRIQTAAIHLQGATAILWRYDRECPATVDQAYFNGLRDLSQKFSSHASTFSSDFDVTTPSLYGSDPESKERADEYLRDIQLFNESAFEMFNGVVIRDLHSGSQTPVDHRNRPSISLPLTLLEPSIPQSNVTTRELEFRFSEAIEMAKLASEQEFPDAAANYHAEALRVYKELSKGGKPNISEKTKLKSDHIGILIKCLQDGRRTEGLERLNKLAKKAEALAAASERELDDSDLHRLLRDIGELYFKLEMWEPAGEFLRLAIFEPSFLKDYPNNKAEMKSIALNIIQTYQYSGFLVNLRAFRKFLADQLREDPILEPQEYRATIDWCRKRNFKVDVMSALPCFTSEKDKDGDFPLHKAVCDPDVSVEVLKQLASDGNAINARGKREWTPILMAVEHGRLAAVRVLLDEGANLDLRTPERDMSETVLHVCKDPQIMRLLLQRIQLRRPSVAPSTIPPEDESIEDLQRIDIDSQDPYIGTALHHSCKEDDWPIVEVLLDCGADPNAENHLHESPLIMACYNTSKGASTKQIRQLESPEGGRDGFTGICEALFQGLPRVNFRSFSWCK